MVRPKVHILRVHLCLLKIFWTFAQRWFFYILFYVFVYFYLYFLYFCELSPLKRLCELIFASRSSFWSFSQPLHSTDGIALSTQWVTCIYNLIICWFLDGPASLGSMLESPSVSQSFMFLTFCQILGISSGCVQGMFRVCSGYVQSMFRVCSEFVQSLFRVGSE